MSTSPTTTGLSRPTTDETISIGTLGYINARNRQRAYNVVIREFKKSGIAQVTLASRMGKAPEVISRLLSRPQNWESDTYSSLLFAISGGIPSYGVDYPFGRPEEATANIQAATSSSQSGQVINLMPYVRGRNSAEMPVAAVKSNVAAVKASVEPAAAGLWR